MTFQEKLDSIQEKQNSLLCVGLDPDIEKLPGQFRKEQHPQFTFCKWIIEQTHDLVCCFKLNSAFYEARGVEGITDLKMTCDFLKATYPDIPIILDFKRGDIGNTNNAYAQFAFDYLQVDAVTLHPYQGMEALQPFLDYKDKGIFVLCKTSNEGSGEFQDLIIRHPDPDRASGEGSIAIDSSASLQNDDMKLYEYITQQVVTTWNTNGNCMLVVGATYPTELKQVRELVGDMTILAPGIGAQAADVQATIQAGINSLKKGLIINSSRSIIFSNNPREEAQKLRDTINSYRT